jgi:hypothetical protein
MRILALPAQTQFTSLGQRESSTISRNFIRSPVCATLFSFFRPTVTVWAPIAGTKAVNIANIKAICLMIFINLLAFGLFSPILERIPAQKLASGRPKT